MFFLSNGHQVQTQDLCSRTISVLQYSISVPSKSTGPMVDFTTWPKWPGCVEIVKSIGQVSKTSRVSVHSLRTKGPALTNQP